MLFWGTPQIYQSVLRPPRLFVRARREKGLRMLNSVGEAPLAAAEEYMTPAEVAAKLKLSTRTLQGWRSSGAGPPYARISATVVRYPVTGFREFCESRTFISTSHETEAA